MPRLIDHLRHDALLWPENVPSGITRQMVQQAFEKATPMVMDTIATQYYMLSSRVGLNLADDCPNSTPPFPFTWAEMKRPQYVNVNDKHIDWQGPDEWGFLLMTVDIWDKEANPDLWDTHQMEVLHQDLRWEVTAFLFSRQTAPSDEIAAMITMHEDGVDDIPVPSSERRKASVRPYGPLGAVVLPLDSTGRFIDGLWAPPGTSRTRAFVSSAGNRGINDSIVSLLEPIWFGLSVANCSNAQLVETIPRRSMARQWKRKTGKELVRYRVVDIKSRSGKKTVTRGPSNPDNQTALHVCRGHFRTYTPEKPLMGKHVGTFWVPAHLKGCKDLGVVNKDYKVVAEEATAG